MSPMDQQIKEKIESVSVPLKDWDIQINHSIKAGFNEACTIDCAMKVELIAADPRVRKLLSPLCVAKT